MDNGRKLEITVGNNDRKTKIYCEMEEGSAVGYNGKMSIYREKNHYDN
jgi:hypothetical protein